MSEIKINLVNNLPYESRIFIDGKEAKGERNKKTGVTEIIAETDKEFTEITVENFSETHLSFWKWFLTTFICWIVSVFGIFDSVTGKTGRLVDVKLNVNTVENTLVKIKFNIYKKDSPAAEIIETNTMVQEISNVYRLDKRAKNRNKIYKVVRILSFIVVAIGGIILLTSL